MLALHEERLPEAAADDATTMTALATLVNNVYAEAEAGLWLDGVDRTNPAEMAEFVRAGQVVVAEADGRITGLLRLQRLDETLSEFGMLAAAPESRGTGVGRALVRFAEESSHASGRPRMQLELLMPREWSHPSKEFLAGWYNRLGYHVVRIGQVDEYYPQLAPKLATPCDFRIYRKDLPAPA